MRIESRIQYEATRQKLRLLEEAYEAKRRKEDGDPHVRELTLSSLDRMIKQLKEEIVSFEAHETVSAQPG